ncbi:hypothetical protein BOX15_Mlig005376g5, partial [Macrostomum lignano]
RFRSLVIKLSLALGWAASVLRMFNLCDNRIQLVLYATTVTIMALGVFYVCLGSFIIGEFLPLLPGVFENPLWGLFYLYLIFTGVYTVVAGCIGLCGVDKYQPGSICLHRVLILLLIGLHVLAMFAFIKDAGYNKERIKKYLTRVPEEVLATEGLHAAKANQRVWNYFEAAINCKRELKSCSVSAAVRYLMFCYYGFVVFLGLCGAVLLADLLLTFFL